MQNRVRESENVTTRNQQREASPSLGTRGAFSPPRTARRTSANTEADSPRLFRGRSVQLDPVDEDTRSNLSNQSNRAPPHRSPLLGTPPPRRPPMDGEFGSAASFAAAAREEHRRSIREIFVDHTPLHDESRAELYEKYLVSTAGLSYGDITAIFMEELGYYGKEVQNGILRGVYPIVTSDDKISIPPKYYSNFKVLEELDTAEFIDFYGRLRIKLRGFGIGLMDFDALLPAWQHVGLTYPGIGEDKYLEMAMPLYDLLETLLPSDDPIVKRVTTTLSGKSQDGFQLLRKVMGMSIPVFCPYKSSKPPVWRKHPDVAEMAKHWNIHFRLMRKTGSVESPVQQSLQFLQSLTEPALLSQVTSIQGLLQAVTEGHDEFDTSTIKLPKQLTIDGITTTLTSLPNPMENSMKFATANYFESIEFSDSDSEEGIQGFSSNATASCNNPRNRQTSRRPRNNNKEDATSKKDIVCRGCHKKGHKEVECRELARWIIVSKAVKKLPDSLRKKVMENYYKFYSTAPPPASISCSCNEQLRTFCSSRSVSTQQLVDAYNWEKYASMNLNEEENGFETAVEDENEDASE
jgi:hypothetical protein